MFPKCQGNIFISTSINFFYGKSTLNPCSIKLILVRETSSTKIISLKNVNEKWKKLHGNFRNIYDDFLCFISIEWFTECSPSRIWYLLKIVFLLFNKMFQFDGNNIEIHISIFFHIILKSTPVLHSKKKKNASIEIEKK